jgi:hypothetical protein
LRIDAAAPGEERRRRRDRRGVTRRALDKANKGGTELRWLHAKSQLSWGRANTALSSGHVNPDNGHPKPDQKDIRRIKEGIKRE